MNIAVLVPCLDEEAAIGTVVRDFRAALPGATVYVFDNGSTDRTVEVARAAGAVVRREPLRGKGNVVRRMFADVEADVYLLVDGDDTYDASAAPALLRALVEGNLDMVNAARDGGGAGAYRPGHRLGNRVLTRMVAAIFGNRIRDMLSGYRAFSRRYVKSFPALSSGFEIETELTVHALELRMPIGELDTRYKERPEGSASKLKTWRDGLRILRTIVELLKQERPLAFFTAIAAALAIAAVVLAIPIFETYRRIGLVPRLPTAVLSTGLSILSFLSLAAGLILDSVARGRRELKRLRYLEVRGPDALSIPTWDADAAASRRTK
jgi:glycosyltransferase involved in cell wall biosynthesis